MRINCAGESGIVYRILIVDDEKIERTGLRLLLGKMDQKFEITEAVCRLWMDWSWWSRQRGFIRI